MIFLHLTWLALSYVEGSKPGKKIKIKKNKTEKEKKNEKKKRYEENKWEWKFLNPVDNQQKNG